jgi:hypothetical protein
MYECTNVVFKRLKTSIRKIYIDCWKTEEIKQRNKNVPTRTLTCLIVNYPPFSGKADSNLASAQHKYGSNTRAFFCKEDGMVLEHGEAVQVTARL